MMSTLSRGNHVFLPKSKGHVLGQCARNSPSTAGINQTATVYRAKQSGHLQMQNFEKAEECSTFFILTSWNGPYIPDAPL